MQQPGQQLDQVFFALSDSTRRGILARLAEGSSTVGELAEPYNISAPAVSRHLRILEQAGLIHRSVKGREHHCSLAIGSLRTAEDWLNFHRSFWESRFTALDDLLRNTDSPGEMK